MWDHVLTPASVLRPTSHRKKQISQSLKYHFHCVQIFVENQHVLLHNKGRGGTDFMKGGRDKLRCFQAFFLILMFCGSPKNRWQHCGNYTCQRFHNF
jgi:DMSO/TMAO reductase YedYZ heme-binding membrane subunit